MSLFRKRSRSYKKVEDSSRSCWVQSSRSLRHYFLIGNNHSPKDSVRKRNDSQTLNQHQQTVPPAVQKAATLDDDVDATNVADIENDHKVVYGLKLPVSYYSTPTKLAENITETCLVSMPYDLKERIIVTFDVVTGKFTMKLLEGVNVQFHREFSRMTGFRRNIAFS